MKSEYRASKPIIKSYVYYGDKCYFVSTIDRVYEDFCGLIRDQETTVREIDLISGDRKEDILYQCNECISHYEVCRHISIHGTVPDHF